MKPSCQEARFSQKSEIQLKGTKVRASSHSSNAERVMFGKSGVVFLPRHLEVMWSQLGPHQGFIRETNGPVSAPQLAFQEPVHTVGLHCAFFTAWAPCVWELFARVKIMHDPIFSRLFTSWRVETPGREKKKKKKPLRLFQLHKLFPEASKCCKKYTQIFRFKFNQIPGHLDLFKCQQPPSFPSYFRLPYISKCFLFHRNSKSNLGAHRAWKSQIKTFPACPTNQLITLQPSHSSPKWKRLQWFIENQS